MVSQEESQEDVRMTQRETQDDPMETFQAEAANEKEFLLHRLHQLLDQERIQVAQPSTICFV